jgi:AcrR family transcriptional regulator
MGRTPVDKIRSSNSSKQKNIVDALEPHYMARGIKAISADDMCEITKKSKATIYKYFDSRKEIVQQILMSKIASLSQFHTVLFNHDLDYLTRYKQAVTIATESVQDISSIFLSDLSELFPDLFEQVVNLKKLSIELLKQFYAEGIKDGAFIDVSTDILAINDELFFDAIVNPEFLRNRNLNLKEAFDGYFKIRFEGIIRK